MTIFPRHEVGAQLGSNVMNIGVDGDVMLMASMPALWLQSVL